jgi:glycine/D-amino acid oxidase-like deaminating enzyme
MRADASWSLVWFGLVWFGLVWFGLAWFGLGHGHWGLTLGPVTGRLVADLLTGRAPFCDPTRYAIE